MKHRRFPLRALMASAIFAGLSAATPASALDDGDQNIFETVKGLVGVTIGIGGGDEKPRIDYRERAPLVLPPNYNLPAPAPGVAERNPAWPKDYDTERVRRGDAARNSRARSDYTENFGAMNAREIREVGRLERNPTRTNESTSPQQCVSSDPGQLCNPTAFWDAMRTSSAPDTSKDTVAGQEPARARLTDPPKGFRTAKRSQRYTFEIKEQINEADPRAQMREDERRARQAD